MSNLVRPIKSWDVAIGSCGEKRIYAMSDERQPMRYFGFRLAASLSELTSHGSHGQTHSNKKKSDMHPLYVENVAERDMYIYIYISLKILEDLFFLLVLRGQTE